MANFIQSIGKIIPWGLRRITRSITGTNLTWHHRSMWIPSWSELTLSATPGMNTKIHSKNNSVWWRSRDYKTLAFLQSLSFCLILLLDLITLSIKMLWYIPSLEMCGLSIGFHFGNKSICCGDRAPINVKRSTVNYIDFTQILLILRVQLNPGLSVESLVGTPSLKGLSVSPTIKEPNLQLVTASPRASLKLPSDHILSQRLFYFFTPISNLQRKSSLTGTATHNSSYPLCTHFPSFKT